MNRLTRFKWRIMRIMLEFARRWGPKILVASIALIAVTFQSYLYLNIPIVTVILLILAIISLVITIIMFVFDFIITHRKDYREKHRNPNIRWP